MARTTAGNITARGQARRDQLIAIALKAFAAQGFRGTAVSAIAAEAGISEPGLLHHFPSKRDLLLGVLEHYEEFFRARGQGLADGGESFCERLLDLARFHEGDPSFIRLYTVLAAESTTSEHPAHEWFRSRYDRVRALFAAGFAADQERGWISETIEPDDVARQVVALLDGLELQFLLSGGRLGIVEPLAGFLGSLRAPRP